MEEEKKIEDEILKELERMLPDLLGIRTKEDAIAKGIEGLLDEKRIRMLSLLFPEEDRELAIYLMIDKIFDLIWPSMYVDALLTLRCSRMGLRANQIVEIAKETKKERGGIIGFFKGLFGRKEKEPPLGRVEVVE
jgi:hypothetical protein